MSTRLGLKDDRLADWINSGGNAAAFASFSPGDLRPRHSFLPGQSARIEPRATDEVVRTLLAQSAARTVNVRTFRDTPAKSTPFRYGLTSVDDVLATMRARAGEGYYTIVNETIDVNDGGVSGVLLGGVAEFAPGTTPRTVETADSASLDADLAFALLQTVYGSAIDIRPDGNRRVEFSLHPTRVGYRNSHTIVWEIEEIKPVDLRGMSSWPNDFSRHIGDKAYGLLMAHLLGLPVPRTTVIPRLVAPFSFGQGTETAEWWIRTCPREPVRGWYTTLRGWIDPFVLLQREDPASSEGHTLASVLAQEAIDPKYSGTLLANSETDIFVQGVAGTGERFMQGLAAPEDLPEAIVEDVRSRGREAHSAIGPMSAEWVHDGTGTWIVQMHIRRGGISTAELNPGFADKWLSFRPDEGLKRLREIVRQAQESGAGVIVYGAVGINSHVGDILRAAEVPARMETGG